MLSGNAFPLETDLALRGSPALPGRSKRSWCIIITRRDDVSGGPVLHALNSRVKARRAPAARPVIVPQDQIHHVGLAVEQGVETRAEDDARAVAVPGCSACSAVARARRHVSGLRRAGGSVLRPAPRLRGGVPPPPVRGGPTAAALGDPPLKARGAGKFRTAPNTRNARHCAARRWRAVVRCAARPGRGQAWPWPPTSRPTWRGVCVRVGAARFDD